MSTNDSIILSAPVVIHPHKAQSKNKIDKYRSETYCKPDDNGNVDVSISAKALIHNINANRQSNYTCDECRDIFAQHNRLHYMHKQMERKADETAQPDIQQQRRTDINS